MEPNFSKKLLSAVGIIVISLSTHAEAISKPEAYELERIVGSPLENPVRVTWKTSEPRQTNLFIYSAKIPPLNEKLMRRVAEHFGINGKIEQIQGDTMGNIGFEIRERNPAPVKDRAVRYWITIGTFSYSSGDNGYRWDLKNRKSLISGVPDKEQAKVKATELLPLLGFSTDDLAHKPDGRIQWASSETTLGYTDRSNMERKRVVMERSITFYQRIPNGGTGGGIGDGGALRISFVSEGKVSGIEWCFRKLKKAAEAKPKTSEEIIRDLKKAKGWTWDQTVPSSLTITNCILAYPQGNSFLNQKYLWPFYELTGSADGKSFSIYVPLEF